MIGPGSFDCNGETMVASRLQAIDKGSLESEGNLGVGRIAEDEDPTLRDRHDRSSGADPSTAHVTSLRPMVRSDAAMVEPPECPANASLSSPKRILSASVTAFMTIVSLGKRRSA